MKGFNASLESLRGIAALSVCFTHSLAVYAMDGSATIWRVPIWQQSLPTAATTFLNAVFNPLCAVLLFFVLSGYVLTKSLDRTSLLGFYVRRGLRILPMMWAAIYLAYVVAQINHPVFANMSDWYRNTFGVAPGWQDLVNNSWLRSFPVLSVTWTMRVELLGSLLIPVMAWFVSRNRWPARLVVLALLILVLLRTRTDFRYMACFYVGALLTDEQLIRRVRRPGLWVSTGMTVCAASRLSSIESDHSGLATLVEMIGTTMILAGVLGRRFEALEGPYVRTLGRLSYSLYLLHPSILGVCVVLLAPHMFLNPVASNVLLFIISAVLALLAAQVTHLLIERPSIEVGRMATRAPSLGARNRLID